MKTKAFAKRSIHLIMGSLLILILPLLLTSCSSTKTLITENEPVNFASSLFGKGFIFQVTESSWANDYEGNKPKYKFLVVKCSITNPADRPMGLASGKELWLMAVSEANVFYTKSFGSSSLAEYALNPNIPENYELVFDIPMAKYKLSLKLKKYH